MWSAWRIAGVLDRIDEPYHARWTATSSIADVGGVLALWRALGRTETESLAASMVFIEQPIKRRDARARRRLGAGHGKPVIIDESDDSLDAFPRAKELGYRGVSSQDCKGIYKSLINAARCTAWGAATS